MTDTPPPTDDDRDTDQPDQSSGGAESRRGGVSGLLRQLLETLQRLDDSGRSVERGRGHRRSGTTSVEYDYSVKIGPADHAEPGDPAEPDQPVSVQDTLDGASVTIDLPAVDPEALRAGVRDRRLVVAEADEQVARVELPEAGYAVRSATYNNGVLEILLEDSNSEVTGDD